MESPTSRLNIEELPTDMAGQMSWVCLTVLPHWRLLSNCRGRRLPRSLRDHSSMEIVKVAVKEVIALIELACVILGFEIS